MKVRDYGTLIKLADERAKRAEIALNEAEEKYGYWDIRTKELFKVYEARMNDYYSLLVAK